MLPLVLGLSVCPQLTEGGWKLSINASCTVLVLVWPSVWSICLDFLGLDFQEMLLKLGLMVHLSCGLQYWASSRHIEMRQLPVVANNKVGATVVCPGTPCCPFNPVYKSMHSI